MNRKIVTLCSVAALVGNSLAALAQNPVPQDKAKTEHRVMVIQNDQVVTSDVTTGVAGIAQPVPTTFMGADFVMAQGTGIRTGAFQASFENKLVKGKPYSADIVQENTQTLGDGNRIVQRSTSSVARDSEGRTRQEISVGFGPLASAMGKAPKIISITDPVSGNNFMLQPEDKTAVKMPSIKIFDKISERVVKAPTEEGARVEMRTPRPTTQRVSGGVLQGNAIRKVQPPYPAEAKAAGVSGAVQVAVTVDEQGNVSRAEAVGGQPLLRDAAIEAARQWQFKPTELSGAPVKVQGILTFNFTLADSPKSETAKKEVVGREVTFKKMDGMPGEMRIELDDNNIQMFNTSKYETKKEDLGTQTIEGVECTGTRSVTTIPAGAVNNELPINIVSESWYSKDLDTAVLRKYNDPRYGENVYRLTNIIRTEPAKELFEIPADYSVKEDGPLRTFQFSDGEGKNMKFDIRTDQKVITKEQ